MLGKMLAKTVLALAVVFVGMGLAVRYVGGHLDSWVHSPIDLALPGHVDGTWKPAHAHRVTLELHGGSVAERQCNLALGSYSVQVDHSFSFTPAATTRERCPGADKIRRALARASKVSEATVHGHEVLSFTSQSGHRVLALRKVGG
jgi:hypothetical protein